MLAVVLVPLSLLVIACLMERLEARVAPTATVRLAARRITEREATEREATEPQAPTEPARRGHLQALPDLASVDDGRESLRRAS